MRGFIRRFSAGCSRHRFSKSRCGIRTKPHHGDRHLRQRDRRATGNRLLRVRLGLKDGSAVQFECVDVFEFDESGRVERMVIVYDTHPVREVVGDKYA